MFTPELPPKTNLDRAIDEVHRQMEDVTADSHEYANMVDQLVKLHAIKTEDGRRRISPDARANIIANLVGILIIVTHERAHIITTKALGFIKKLG